MKQEKTYQFEPLPQISEYEKDAKRLDDVTEAVLEAIQGKTHTEADQDLERLERLALRKYPSYQEEIVILLRLPQFLRGQVIRLKKEEKSRLMVGSEEDEKHVLSLAEQNHLLTHFIIKNQNNRTYLEQFWKRMTDIASAIRTSGTLIKIRRGVLSQAAAFVLFEAARFEPELTKPREDVSPGGDLWANLEGEKVIVQVKGHRSISKPYLISGSGEVSFFTGRSKSLAVHEKRIIKKDEDLFLDFAMRVDSYNRRNNTAVEPVLLALPEDEIDPVSGMPSQKLLEEVVGAR